MVLVMEATVLTEKEAKYIGQLYESYGMGMYRLIYCKIHQKDEDSVFSCLQETYIIAMQKVKQCLNILSRKAVKSWLYRTAINIVLNFNKRMHRYYERFQLVGDDSELMDRIAVPEAAVVNQELLEDMCTEVKNIMQKELKAYEAALYQGKYVHGKTQRQLSRELGVNEKTLSVHMKQLRSKIYEFIELVLIERGLK